MRNPLHTLHRAYWESTTPIRILTILMYPLAMLGLYWAWKQGSSDMDWMFHLLEKKGVPEYCHALFWGLLIAYVWCARVLGVFVFDGYKWTLRTTPILGIAFWSMLLASNLHDADTLAFGTLYGICALIETWILSRNWLETQ